MEADKIAATKILLKQTTSVGSLTRALEQARVGSLEVTLGLRRCSDQLGMATCDWEQQQDLVSELSSCARQAGAVHKQVLAVRAHQYVVYLSYSRSHCDQCSI